MLYCFQPVVPALECLQTIKTAVSNLGLLCKHSPELSNNGSFGLQNFRATSCGLLYQFFYPMIVRAAKHNDISTALTDVGCNRCDLIPIHGVGLDHVRPIAAIRL